MKNQLLLKLHCLLFISCIVVTDAQAQKKGSWKLVWREEFNYKGLPDPNKWNYENGHVRNQEQQYYTNARSENARVQNGVLTITGKKESYPNSDYIKGSTGWQHKDSLAQYTSASINTNQKAEWQYGRIEVKAKLPHGGGIWPAIWMMGIDRERIGWPGCGEIDIMEFIGNHPQDIYGTIHFADTSAAGGHRSSGSKTTATTLQNDFHIYALEWNKDAMDIYFDDQLFHHFVIDSAGTGNNNPFRKPFYLLLNLAIGAQWPGPIDDAVLPQQYVVDYVRVYKKKH
jgi:beta-glucanase (GH16 family)